MIFIIISFFLGILSLYFFHELPSNLTVIISVGILVAFSVILSTIFSLKQLNKLIISFILGFCWVLLHAKTLITQWIPTAIEGKPIKVIGTIQQIPETSEEVLSFEFKIKETQPKDLWPNPGRVKIHWRDPITPIKVGEEWQFFLRLKRPRSYSNLGSFDRERQFFQKRLVAEGYVVDELPYQKRANSGFGYLIDRVRSYLKNLIFHSLEGKHFLGIINALVIGEKDKITFDQWQVFKNTGTAHLMAISGLHIGLVASFAFMFTRFIGYLLPLSLRKIPVQWLAALVSIIIASGYAVLAGFSIPTQRALTMVILLMVGILRRRCYSLARNYFLALGGVLLLDPLSTLSLGFWLSFSAVGIILYGMRGRLNIKGAWWRWGRLHGIIFLGLAPLSLASFGSLSLSSPLANLIAIPWVSLWVIPCSLVGIFIGLIHNQAGTILLKIAEYFMALLWPLLKTLSTLPHWTWSPAYLSNTHLILFFIGILLLLAPRGIPGKGMGIIWLLPFFLTKPTRIESNQALITVLDVGQGLATIVETKKHLLVFDTGPKLSAYSDTGEKVILPFLKSRGRKSIDMLVISHGDMDHIGGAYSILNSLPVGMILTSEPELFPGKQKMSCHSNQQWQWDGVKFEILHPDSKNFKKRNDYSCVLKVTTKVSSALLTADIEVPSERRLLERVSSKLKSTVMLVPHHGSRTSSSLEFIQAVNPEYAIIPVGYHNRYGHPKPDIVTRYQKTGIKVLDTVHDGAISLLLTNENPLVIPHCYRLENKRYWHFISYPYIL